MTKKITTLKEFTLDANDNIIDQVDITPLVESYSVKMADGRTLEDVWENIRTRMVDVELRIRELEIKTEDQNKIILDRLEEIEKIISDDGEKPEDVEDEEVVE